MSTPYSGARQPGASPGYEAPAPDGYVDEPAPDYPAGASAQGNYAQETAYAEGTYAAAPAAGAHSGSRAASAEPSSPSVGQLISEVTQDLSTLMRQEMELAKVELRAEAKKAGKGAGLLGVAGFAGYMTALFLSIAAMWALAHVIDIAVAGAVIAALWGVVAVVGAVMGRKELQRVRPPERTVETLQQVPGALKPH